MPAHFDDIAVGQVVSLGVAAVDARALETFAKTFVPGWTEADGAPEPFLYALWSRLDAEAASQWPHARVQACGRAHTQPQQALPAVPVLCVLVLAPAVPSGTAHAAVAGAERHPLVRGTRHAVRC